MYLLGIEISHAGTWFGLATTTNAAVAPEVLRRHYGWTAGQFRSPKVASVSSGVAIQTRTTTRCIRK